MTPRRNFVAALAVAAVAWMALLWLGGGGPWSRWLTPSPDWPVRAPWPDGTIWAPGPPIATRPPSIEEAIRIQERSEPRLFALPEVEGVGVGWTAGGRVALKVFVEPGKLPVLPSSIDGLPIVIRRAGPFRALGVSPQERGTVTPSGSRANDDVLPTGRFERPVPLGVSTGHTNSTAGTLGALVTDGRHTYALSNWHVFVPAGEARLGDVLLQPGPYDGGLAPADVIGTLAAFEPVTLSPFASNRIDAALAMTELVAPSTPPDGYGSPRSEPLAAIPGLAVKKYGRTTGLTYGTVDAIHGSINVTYGSSGSQVARFTGQIILCCNLSSGGDSGSLIVAHDVDEDGHPGPDDRRPVALLFAGDPTLTIANPIELVLERFGVSIVEGEDR